ncbi:hypothetical protein CGCF415_v005429 [Colletotrichum fructicola]|nr:hypothetical protein CGCFRS4_v003307 [Colletotrichum fructicola]KAF4910202.1 hypothetical protein CGCF415_v005429 [Colletotrichum fructicola]
MGQSSYFSQAQDADLFMKACLKRLITLIENNRMCPSAVDGRNRSFMHHAAMVMSKWLSISGVEPSRTTWLVELVRLLLLCGVLAFSYDISGISPLRRLHLNSLQQNHEVVNILLCANSDEQSAVVAGSQRAGQENAICLNSKPFYETSHGYAEACECGPLSMAVIRDDVSEAVRILESFPSSMNEADIYGQTPLHLAATRPRILAVLVEAADHELLGKTDITGATALDTAMIRSSSVCVNGSTYQRCRRCACTQSVEILLRAGCNPRWHKRRSADGTCDLFFVLGRASELARRRYVFQMKLLQHLH